MHDVLARIADKAGALGSVVASLGCASCFPALASIGSAVGLGFLSRYEGLFINTLLPVFAVVAFGASLLAAWTHRRPLRLAISALGPLMVLATLYLFWTDDWSTQLFYGGIVLMLSASIWDLIRPARPACAALEGRAS